MIVLSSIDLFNLLRQKIGENEAKAVTGYIEVQVEDKFESGKKYFATKEDLVREISSLEVKMEKGFKDQLKWMIVLFAPFYIGMIVFLVKVFIK